MHDPFASPAVRRRMDDLARQERLFERPTHDSLPWERDVARFIQPGFKEPVLPEHFFGWMYPGAGF